jgi:hypothetical protein
MSTKKSTTATAQSLPSGDSATYQSRPRRKPDSSTKGKLNRWEGSDYLEFVPAGSKPSNRSVFKQVGPSSFYKSEGQKESSYSIHINVDGSSADPVNEAREIFNVLTADQAKQKPTLSENCQGRMLFDNGEGLQIWHDSEANKLTIMAQLECTADIERQLLQVEAQMNVVVGRNRKDLVNNNNK